MAASNSLRNTRKARLLAGLFVALLLPVGGNAAPAAPKMTMEQVCAAVGGRLQSVGAERCRKLGLQFTGGATYKGVPLMYRDYPATVPQKTPPRVMMIGGIHGDELTSVSVAFQWMGHLAAEEVRQFHWRVLPYVNADGLLARPATRGNARGVDLNRNFATADWTADALAYWVKRTRKDPRRYPGPTPGSEPETQLLVEQIEQFRPDAIVSIHAPYGVLDYDGPEQPPKRFGYLRLHQLGTYPGSLGNYAGTNLGLPVITLELPHAGIMPTAAQSQRIWADMQSWLEKNLPRQVAARQNSLTASAE